MNILHHKSWHVRTKKNIEKVRRDEQRALEEQTEKARKADIAEQERRIQQLRNKFSVGQSVEQSSQNDKDEPKQRQDGQQASASRPNSKHHVNFFQHEYDNTKNKAHALEKKIEQETWEKKVGILTYLGGNQSGGKSETPWYERLPTQLDNQEIGCREALAIQRDDPLNKIKKELNSRKKDEEDLKKKRQFLLDKQERQERYKNKFNKFRDGYDRLKAPRDRKPTAKPSSERRRSVRSEDERLKSSKDGSLHNRPDAELSEKELQLKLLREKRLKREQKECKKSKDLLVTQSPFFCLDDRQRAYSNQFNPHLARR